MADNTVLNLGAGGDTVRTLAKTANSPAKTQVIALDVGGGDATAETLLVLGQSAMATSVPVTIANNQTAVPVSGTVGITGTVPVSGTFWQATQPVSLATVPLPTNAAQETGGNLALIYSALAGTLTTQPSSHATTANSGTGTLVANTATQILPANATRRKIIFTNNGSSAIYLSWYNAATMSTGIVVAGGTSYFDDNPFNTALSAISGSSCAYTIQEG